MEATFLELGAANELAGAVVFDGAAENELDGKLVPEFVDDCDEYELCGANPGSERAITFEFDGVTCAIRVGELEELTDISELFALVCPNTNAPPAPTPGTGLSKLFDGCDCSRGARAACDAMEVEFADGDRGFEFWKFLSGEFEN